MLNTNKRSVTIELQQPEGQERLRQLVANVDIVIHNYPYKDYRSHEITMAHGGGWAWLSPGALDDSELPPLKAFGHHADFQGALAAATVTLGAYYLCRFAPNSHPWYGSHRYVSSMARIAE